nr:glycine betaine/L-proline ABC transporter ATP-binding protein [Pseudohalocynthiibacter aestuariivivens]
MSDNQPIVSCRGIWKVFGRRADEALAAIRKEGVGKSEVLQRFQCVVGVADVSFDVYRGEIFCVMGLSGSGKSTLIRHINRLIDPTDGSIVIEGTEINGLGAEALRNLRANKISMVFQGVALLPYRTVLDNTALGLEFRKVPRAERHDAAMKALEAVQLTEWADRYPAELSGGMMQRVGLARALVSDSDILLMDEPFSALDPLIRRELQEQFLGLTKQFGKTTIFITHDLEEAIRVGDRIGVMRDGVMVQIGTPEDIVLHPADDYVQRFTAGLAKNHVVSARSLMVPCDTAPPDAADLPRTDILADIDCLIDQFLTHEGKVLAVEDEGRIVGTVSVPDLLRGIRGPKNAPEPAETAPT